MKRMLSFLLLLSLCCSCFHRSAVMTQMGFSEIEPGMSIQEVEVKYGKPFAVHSRDGNSDIYEYVERIMNGPEVVTERRYYLIIANKKVVGKYMKYENAPAFEEIYSDDAFPNY